MKTNSQRGFTIIELMVTLVVAAILLTVAVPSYQSMIQNNRAASQANSIVSALNIARSEAIKRTASVQVCISSDQDACIGTNWAEGWLVWVDLNGSDDPDDATEIILSHGVLDGSVLTAVDQANASVASVTYLGTGFTNLPIGSTVTFALQPTNCSTSNNYRREIELIPMGRPNTTVEACS